MSARRAALAAAMLLSAGRAMAAGQAADAQADAERPAEGAVELPFKATAGLYRYSGAQYAVDLNLRYASASLGNFWVGYYDSRDLDERQGRVGWDRVWIFDPVRFLLTAQAASTGFFGAAFAAEIGAPFFVGGGLGRTNLRPYVNLNFDPNDAYLVTVGWRGADGRVAMIQYIRDNRENPDQRNTHFIYRAPLAGGPRLTLDVLFKQGLVDGQMIHKWGASVGFDWARWFARVAWDPDENFTTLDMWRFSVGARF
jgi:hypothetical protein